MYATEGENNVRNIAGSLSNKSGYACQQKSLVDSWRREFSKIPRTTNPLAPFGITQLAGYCSEGFPWNSGAFRLAQTGGYGFLPNPEMPATFLGQAFDLGDPWAKGCLQTKACFGWDTPWSFNRTCWYEVSYIHPRDKAPLGQRLANAALSVHYNRSEVHTQPVITGCSLMGSVSDGQHVIVVFDAKKMGDDQLLIQKFDKQEGASATEVLLDNATWTFVNTLLPGENSSSLRVVLQPGMAITGIRYGWGDNPCCGTNNRTLTPCPPASCPLITKRTKEPAVPWQAMIDSRTKRCVLAVQ